MKQTRLCHPEALGSHGQTLQSLPLVSCHAASQVSHYLYYQKISHLSFEPRSIQPTLQAFLDPVLN